VPFNLIILCRVLAVCLCGFSGSESVHVMQVFEYSLHKSLPDTNLNKRLRNISEAHTYNVYTYGCTGIFEKHKLLFSFQITIKLKLDEGLVRLVGLNC